MFEWFWPVELWKPKDRNAVADPVNEEEKCLYPVAWGCNVGSGNDGARDKSGIRFWMRGTRVTALLCRFGAKI